MRERKRSTMAPTEGWPKEKAFLPGEKTTIAISAPQRVQSSLAFLKRPERRFEKVTRRLLSFDILVISILWRPLFFLAMVATRRDKERGREGDKMEVI